MTMVLCRVTIRLLDELTPGRKFGLTAVAMLRESIFSPARIFFGKPSTDPAVLTGPAVATKLISSTAGRIMAGRGFIIELRRRGWNRRYWNTRLHALLPVECFIEVQHCQRSKATSSSDAFAANE